MYQITKKSVFITGVSSGFGFQVTKKLLEQNYFVVAVIRGGMIRGKNIFSEFSTQIANKQLILLDGHLDNRESLESCLIEAFNYFPDGLDILINNAGFGLLGPVELQEEKQIRMQFETNFFAPLFIIQKLLPLLRKKQGRIINLSSLVGFNVFPFYGIYSASKHAIDSLTEALYYDLSIFKIQVCAIEPGGYKTGFSQNSKVSKESHHEFYQYEKRMIRFSKFLEFIQKKIEKDPAAVVDTIIKLCNKKNIPVRIRVGTESHINWFLKKILPDQCRIILQDWVYRRFFF